MRPALESGSRGLMALRLGRNQKNEQTRDVDLIDQGPVWVKSDGIGRHPGRRLYSGRNRTHAALRLLANSGHYSLTDANA